MITKGAVMSFQNQNGLTVDGIAGQQVWTALLADAAARQDQHQPYVYVLVSKQLPETLTLYENGAPDHGRRRRQHRRPGGRHRGRHLSRCSST